MSIYITGAGSTIVKELGKLFDGRDETWVISGVRFRDFDRDHNLCDVDLDCERYLFAHGLLRPLQLEAQTPEEIAESLAVNLISIVQLCDYVLEMNSRARICVIGSESGINGSFDTTYALGKAALHAYVKWKKLGPDQQLVAISPDVIEDSGMTRSRAPDQIRALMAYAHRRPRGKLLQAMDVAAMVFSLLYGGSVQNTLNSRVVRIPNAEPIP